MRRTHSVGVRREGCGQRRRRAGTQQLLRLPVHGTQHRQPLVRLARQQLQHGGGEGCFILGRARLSAAHLPKLASGALALLAAWRHYRLSHGGVTRSSLGGRVAVLRQAQ